MHIAFYLTLFLVPGFLILDLYHLLEPCVAASLFATFIHYFICTLLPPSLNTSPHKGPVSSFLASIGTVSETHRTSHLPITNWSGRCLGQPEQCRSLLLFLVAHHNYCWRYCTHRLQRNPSWTDLGILSLLTSFHGAGRCYEDLRGRKTSVTLPRAGPHLLCLLSWQEVSPAVILTQLSIGISNGSFDRMWGPLHRRKFMCGSVNTVKCSCYIFLYPSWPIRKLYQEVT